MRMIAEVMLWGKRIGVVHQEDVNSVPRFNYDRDFLRSGIQLSPIVMPLNDRIYSFPTLNEDTFHGLPGLLADSLPDKFGTALLEKYLEGQGRTLKHLTAVERLCYTGTRGMGALEYQPARGGPIESQSIDIDALVQVASDILSQRENIRLTADERMMAQILNVGTSAGGARAKAVIAWNEKTGDIRSGQISAGDGYDYWLTKFDGVENNKDKGDKADGAEFTRIEYAYSLMAKAAGIEMSECRLHEESGRYHFMTKRFDRVGPTGEKLHMQSLGAIAHYDFNMPGANSYEQAAMVIQKLGMGHKDIAQLYRRLVFNVLAMNRDDHVKNISFLMDKKGVWSLAPAYDLTYAYEPGHKWMGLHQMSVNGKRDNITREDLIASAKHMNISKPKAIDIIDHVAAAIKEWPKFAMQAKLGDEIINAMNGQLGVSLMASK